MPFGETDNESYHWHIEIMPKLIYVAGFEWGTGFYINPVTPEEAARLLRENKIATIERRSR
jgi:UDPglucose--hexose-1-phosphate uridylyltransferase